MSVFRGAKKLQLCTSGIRLASFFVYFVDDQNVTQNKFTGLKRYTYPSAVSPTARRWPRKVRQWTVASSEDPSSDVFWTHASAKMH